MGHRQHRVAWILACRLGAGSGMSGLQQCLCRGSEPNGVHGLGGLLEPLEDYRRSIGHTSWSTLAFGALLVNYITLELDICTLEV